MVCVRVELTLFGPSVETSQIVRSFCWPSSSVGDRELTTKDLSSGAMNYEHDCNFCHVIQQNNMSSPMVY